VRKAFRTVGLVRGGFPYTLVIDDLQIDERSRNYVWGMTLPPDVILGGARVGSTRADAAEADVTLSETQPPDLGNARPAAARRHLLVRVLNAARLGAAPAVVGRVAVPNPPQPDVSLNRLHLASEAVSPGFKLLLFPYVEGQPLPATRWDPQRERVAISWPGQTDVVRSSAGGDGRTRVEISRQGGATVALP
jgi:hypothetical protein